MANEKGMTDDRKAKLDAIRAANAAKKAAEGGVVEAAPVAQIVETPSAAPVAAALAKVGASMSDEKKAKLEAIRAAKAAEKDTVAVATTATAPAAAATTTAPVAAAVAAAVAAPQAATAQQLAAKRVPDVVGPKPAKVIEDDTLTARVYVIRAVVGAVFGVVLCLLLASLTGKYVTAAIWGAFLGAALGVLVLSWPPVRTTGE